MLLGAVLLLNFVVVWAPPLVAQGIVYHGTPLGCLCRRAYARADRTLGPLLGGVLYRRAKDHEYALAAALVFVSVLCNLCLYLTGTTGELVYLLAWVGVGGRCMGGAYTLAHAEAHKPRLYKLPVHVFENYLGVFYGGVPHNFTTSHIHIHHRLDAARGDTMYVWDLPRNSPLAFARYTERVFWHMCGLAPLRYFWKRGMRTQYRLLLRGVLAYWTLVPALLLGVTRSPRAVFFAWLQPLLAMSVFLALVNWAQHGFIEVDARGAHDPAVNATSIVAGRDDYFRENAHWEHHYRAKGDERAGPATVFRDISIPELAVLMIFDRFETLGAYTDMSPALMRRRAARVEA